jgi:ISXO2-like transposase domain/Transposase zinc-ribbon domain
MNLIDVTRQFPTDEKCLKYIEAMRWPDGKVRCVVCGCDRISRITRKSTSKNVRKSIYQCLEPTCKQQFSATSGTIFNDSHLPLHKWFMALAIVVDANKSISANQLKTHLGIGSYRTAWYMAHRIRKAMQDDFPFNLSGIVEVDETYIGGKAKRRGVIRTAKPPKDTVVGMRERGGRVKFVHVPDLKKDSCQAVPERHIAPDVQEIISDDSSTLHWSLDPGLRPLHHTVNHSRMWITPEGVHSNTIESAFSLLKRGLIGSFHRVTIKHLHRYLSEFEFRFNIRKADDKFTMTLQRMAGIAPMPCVELIGEPKA